GVPLDATAPLPEHFAASMVQLGFDENDSDAAPEADRGPMPKDMKKKVARQHSKQIRKDARTERRDRAGQAGGKRKLGKKSNAKFAKGSTGKKPRGPKR
ncbi:MAG: RNA pseudouridine synthase, partial [Pontixanthobacter sp.]